MLKIKFTPAVVVAFVFGATLALPALAGPGGGPTGDGLSVTRADGGAKLIITDPLRSGNPGDYQYQLFGAAGDTLVVGDWNGDGSDSFGLVRVDNGNLLWILDFAGNGSLTYELFGSAGDTPVVGDYDSVSPGTELGFVRPDGGALRWVIQDTTAGPGFSQLLFGAATDLPVVGNWDGDAGNGDELGLVRDDNGARLWITQGSGGLDYNLFGAAGDPPIAGDWDGDGNTDRGVRPTTGDGNVFILDLAPLEYLQFGAPTDTAVDSGNIGQP